MIVDGITIYSVTDQKPRYVQVNGKRVYSGIDGMCVELVRRYIIKKRGITFPSISNAYEIVKLPHFTDIYNGSPIPFTVHKGGSPSVGSIIVWGKEYNKTGHLAIVVEDNGNCLKIMEQNTKTPIRIIKKKSVKQWIHF